MSTIKLNPKWRVLLVYGLGFGASVIGQAMKHPCFRGYIVEFQFVRNIKIA